MDLKTLTMEDLLGHFKADEERDRIRFGVPVDGKHLMLTRKQWESYAGRKKSSSETPSTKVSSDQWGGCDKLEDKPFGAKTEQKNKNKFKCYNCGEKGHFERECPVLKKKRQDKAMLAEKQEEEPALLFSEAWTLACGSEVTHGKVKTKPGDNTRYDSTISYLDTGASNHMLGVRELFTELNKSITGSVKFGDGSLIEIVERGSALITAQDGFHRGLTDVYFILKLKSNIVSLGQLEEQGCRIALENGYLQIIAQQQELLIKVLRGKTGCVL